MRDRWQKMSIFEQMGNISSEISRAEGWEKKGDAEARNNALARALELINFTLDDRKNQGRLKEAARLQEIVADKYAASSVYQISLRELSDYLLPFAIKARENNCQ